jgi:hypothetical protein
MPVSSATRTGRQQQEIDVTTQDTVPERTDRLARAPTTTIVEPEHGILERYRAHAAARKRRLIARWLRRTATHSHEAHALARRRETLLHYRVAAVRADLLEIAAMLERANDADPACITALHDLLANGCDSPLYNSDIHVSELHATLHYVRGGLT